MAKSGRPSLGKEVVLFSIAMTTSERDLLQSIAHSKGISLARCVIYRALSPILPDEVSIADIELMVQIANRCGGKIKSSVIYTILNSGEH